VRCYGEHVGEHIKIPSPLAPNPLGALKENKSRHPESIGCMKFLFAKEFIAIFRLG